MNKEKVKEYFDSLAPSWDGNQVTDDEIINRILDIAEIHSDVDVLDVACGTGVLFPYYIERGVRTLTAIDLAPCMAAIAREKFPQVETVCGDAEEYEFQRKFDTALIYNALPHFENPHGLIAALKKHLKTGGRLTVAHGMSEEALRKHHNRVPAEVSGDLPDCDAMAAIFESCGYTVTKKLSNECMYTVSAVKNE